MLCAALVVISLAALRNTTTPDAPVKLMSGSRVDYSTRLATARASRGAPRVLLTETTQPPTTTTLAPPPTTAAPKPAVVKQAAVTTTTAKPKPKPTTTTTAKPKPAATSTTPTTVSQRPMPTGGSTADGSEEGKASWYDAKYHASNPWICAHKTLPMGTILTVTATATGKTIKCEVGDRGPYADGRILDLSKYAFSQLANPSSGLVWVKISW